MDTSSAGDYSLGRLAYYFLRLGTIGFGGPIALVGYMEHDLVENRKWLTREEYLRGLALSQLAPGPLAAQLGGETLIVDCGADFRLADPADGQLRSAADAMSAALFGA